MAWRITSVEDQRKLFINYYLEEEFSFSELCKQFQISRKTGYKWVERFEVESYEGLKDQRRARQFQNKTNEELEKLILDVKSKRMSWGPKKILGFLMLKEPDKSWPSSTTIGNVLLRHGFQKTKEIKKRLPERKNIFSYCGQPNDLWSIDFKGWFRTKEGIKCDPLTITDSYSRFLLHCSKLPLSTTEYVWNALEKNFHEYGLPLHVRHDNGPPFATCGAGRLSRLSVNLVKAGVIPEWIDPGKPYQNGRHERMHRTLKAEGIVPQKLTLKEQQLKFSEFQHYFNFERPHESLGQKTPGSLYTASSRKWDGLLKSPTYDSCWQVVRVRSSGQISWRGDEVFISKLLTDEPVGLKENEDGDWEVFYGPLNLGIIDKEGHLLWPLRQLRSKRLYKERIY